MPLVSDVASGGLIYNSDIPDTVFLIGNINKGDSFSLRKLLRNHDITTVVLASPRGSVWEGLNMAGIVFDKGLKVHVPEKATCASSFKVRMNCKKKTASF